MTVARSAIKAGFDAIELHGASEYLIGQFIQDVWSTFQDMKMADPVPGSRM